MSNDISRRAALKIMGTSTLAIAAATSGIGTLLTSCSPSAKEGEKAGVLPQEEQADKEFTLKWTEKFIEGLDKEMTGTADGKVSIKEAMRVCSRVCYDKNGFDELIPENDFEKFLKIAVDDFKWNVDYNREQGIITVHENNTECLCPMVRACASKLKPTLCRCTETELERMFSRAFGHEVKATVTESILMGQKTCIYQINLNQ